MEEIERTGSNFPNDFLSPRVKEGPEYSLKWAEAIDGQSLTLNNGFYQGMGKNNRTIVNRAYARAEQPIDKYKPILGVKDKRLRNDPTAISYKVLSWENLGIAPKFINVLIGNLMKQNNSVGVRAVDKYAQDERRKKQIELEDHVVNGQFYDNITQQTGIQFERPDQQDIMPLPENIGEVPVYMDMFYKEDYCLIMQDMLKVTNEQDNYNSILMEVARDMVETRYGVTKTYRVQNKVKRRRCVPERMVMSSTNKDDCTDLKYIGEYWDLTIGQLKEIAGDQFTEEEYKKISEEAGKYDWSSTDVKAYYENNLCYPWDNTKITVGDFVWWSPDWETHQTWTDVDGNITFDQKSFEWWEKMEKKGITVDSFNQNNEGRQVIRYPIDNQYQCMWVKGTKYVFNYGKSRDMIRNESSVGENYGPFTVYKLKTCITELCIPIFDNIQINWLQYQHHAAKSRPAGMDIEFSALQDISIEGAGGKKMLPKDVLQVYFDTGILLWRRRDASGAQSNWRPVNELNNGLNPAAAQHFQNIINNINLLRDICGLNELTDASTPNSEMGKAVANLAVGATKDALAVLHFGFDQINLKTHEKTMMYIMGMARTGLAPQYAEALGLNSVAKLKLLSDLSMHDLGVYTILEPSVEMRARLSVYVQEGIKAGTLYPEEAFEIDNEPNIYRAVRLLKMYRQQKMREAEKQKNQDIQANAQVQAQSAQQAADLASRQAQEENQAKIQYEWQKAQAQMMVNKQKASDDAFLMTIKSKLDTQQALTEEEAHRLTEMMKIERTGQYQLQAAAMKPKQLGPSKK